MTSEDFPFSTGSEVNLSLSDGRHLTFTILKPFEPFEKGVALLARCHCDTFSPSTTTVILKIFDPRFRHERLEYSYCPDWVLEVEDAALDDCEPLRWGDSGHCGVPKELWEMESDEEDGDEKRAPMDAHAVARLGTRWEKHLQDKSNLSFESELRAYRCLKELQGTSIPRLLGVGRYIPSMTERRLKPHVLVLEYIDGTIARYAPPEAFTPPIVAQLYHALERINELGVVHSDLHWGNFIITPSRGVVIDFGEAVLKEKWDESEEEWEECVRCCCEPVAVTALVKGKRVEWSEEFGMPEYKLQPVRTSVT